MGRTVMTYSHVMESERERLKPFRRALSKEDQEAFDRLFGGEDRRVPAGRRRRVVVHLSSIRRCKADISVPRRRRNRAPQLYGSRGIQPPQGTGQAHPLRWIATLVRSKTLKTIAALVILLFLAVSARMALADCIYNGVSYPTGTNIGGVVCQPDGTWR